MQGPFSHSSKFSCSSTAKSNGNISSIFSLSAMSSTSFFKNILNVLSLVEKSFKYLLSYCLYWLMEFKIEGSN